MAAIRSTENKAERSLRRALWRRGLRYRLYDRNLPGKPDLVFPSAKIVLFVDGDYWHGRVLLERGPAALRRSFGAVRRDWWIAKIKANVARDQRVTTELRRQGWTVLRVWERDVMRDPERVAGRLAKRIRRELMRL